MRSAAVYALRDRILIHPWQRTSAGLSISSEPYAALPPEVGDQQLGERLLAVLSVSGQMVPHPENWTGFSKPRLDAAGVTSERAFQTNAQSVTVEWQDDVLHFEPTRNGGTRGSDKGFHPLPESAFSVSFNAGAAAVGLATRTALGRCV
jgi:hypothetical protein